MSKKRVLIVNGSPRPRKNTAWLSSIAIEWMQKNGIETKAVLAGPLKSVNNGCTGCEGCQRSKDFLCVFKDDIQSLVASMPSYDYIVFATPVYFFSPTAQIKLILDRMFSLIKSNDKGEYRHPFSPKTKFGLIVTAGGNEQEGIDLVVEMFKRTAEIMERPLETLLMPNAPMSPEELSDADLWQKKAEEFCQRLIS